MNINNDTQTFTKSFPRVPGNRTKQMTSSKTKKKLKIRVLKSTKVYFPEEGGWFYTIQ